MKTTIRKIEPNDEFTKKCPGCGRLFREGDQQEDYKNISDRGLCIECFCLKRDEQREPPDTYDYDKEKEDTYEKEQERISENRHLDFMSR